MSVPNTPTHVRVTGAELGSECERCGESLLGTIQAEVIPTGSTEAVAIHEACVDRTDKVLRVYEDDDNTD